MSATQRPISIILVEDGNRLRGAARELAAAEGLSVAATVSSGREAAELVREHHPEILVMPTHLRDMPWVQLVRNLRDMVAIVVITPKEHGGEVYDAIIEGARGCIVTWFHETDLIDAMESVHRGEFVLGPQALKEFVIAAREHTRSAKDEPATSSKLSGDLTKRELEILALLTRLNYREIAEKLAISVSTARTHGRNIRSKLGVSNTRGAISKAYDLGLIERRTD